MANQRVVSTDVQAVLGTTQDVQVFIVPANLTVTERLATSGYSDERKQQIELYLTAHIATTYGGSGVVGNIVEMEADGARVKYESMKLGEGLQSSKYGKVVAMLDYLGILSKDSMTMRAATVRVD